MPGTNRSARLVIVTSIVSAACAIPLVAAYAATPAPSAQAPTAAAAPGDACSLMTKEDAAEALGEAVSGSKSTGSMPAGPGMTASNCSYSGSGYHEVDLSLYQLSPDAAAIYRAMCAQKGKEGLAGLGDISCWYDGKHEELQVLKGTTFFSIELRGFANPTEPIKVLARKVFGRLK